MNSIRWLVHKDLARFFADRNGALLTFLIPMLLAALLGSLFGQDTRQTEVQLLLVDGDGSRETKSLIAALDASETLDVEVVDEAEARERIGKGDASVALLLPEGTGAKLNPVAMFFGKPLPVKMLHDPSKRVEADLSSGLVMKILMEEIGGKLGDPAFIADALDKVEGMLALASLGDQDSAQWMRLVQEARKLLRSEDEDSQAEPAAAGRGMRPPLELEREVVTAAGPSSGYNSYAHSFAGMLCMFLLFWAIDAGKETLAEKKLGVILRIRMSRASRVHMLTARALSVVVISMFMSIALYAMGMLVFGIEVLGSWAGFILVLVAQSFFVGGLTLLFLGLAKSERQLMNIGMVAVLFMSFLGGAWMPTFVLPEWVQSIAQVLPTHWSTNGLAAMTWRGLPFEDALLPSAVLLVQGLAGATVGWFTYRWE